METPAQFLTFEETNILGNILNYSFGQASTRDAGYGIQTSPSISKIIECLITGKKWPEKLKELSIHPETLSPKRFIKS